MYQIVEREYREDLNEIKESGFHQEWVDEEFWANRENQSVVFESEDLAFIIQLFIDGGYHDAYVRNNGDEVAINVFALYDKAEDRFLYITKCEIRGGEDD